MGFMADGSLSRRWGVTIALLVGCPSAALAQLAAVPDITVDLSGVIVTDHEVAVDDLEGGIALENFMGALPQGVEVDAYHDDGSLGVLFSLDTMASLPGSVLARPGDVVRLAGGVFTLEFDATSEGVPDGVNVDAVTLLDGHLVLSFDVTVVLDGTTFADEDLVRFDGTVFTSALDASAIGVDAALDTDAAHALGSGLWALSFDGDGTLGSVTFADEDVVSVDTSGPAFAMLFDASAEHAGWRPADLVALPEPGMAASLLAGAIALAGLARATRANRP